MSTTTKSTTTNYEEPLPLLTPSVRDYTSEKTKSSYEYFTVEQEGNIWIPKDRHFVRRINWELNRYIREKDCTKREALLDFKILRGQKKSLRRVNGRKPKRDLLYY